MFSLKFLFNVKNVSYQEKTLKKGKKHNKLNSSNIIDLIKTAIIRYTIKIFLFVANSTLDYSFFIDVV